MMNVGIPQAQRHDRWLGGLGKMACVGAMAAILGGCATLGGGSPEKTVATRAQERWDAVAKQDWKTAYTYNTPAFRAAVPLDKYSSMHGKDVSLLGAKIDSVTCESADRCVARVGLTAMSPLMGRRSIGPSQFVTYMDETWLLEDGQWWIFQKI